MELFLSYCHADDALRKRLDVHLRPLVTQGVIDVWHDRLIEAGQDFDLEIKSRLESASIILLLVSPDFLVSDYIASVEMHRALQRHAQGSARVIPVIASSSSWKFTPLGRLTALPRDGLPLDRWDNLNEALLQVAEEVRRVALTLGGRSSVDASSASGTPPVPTIPTPRKTLPLQAPPSPRHEPSQLDRERFTREGMTVVLDSFWKWTDGLQRSNPALLADIEVFDSPSFTGVIHRAGQVVCECFIRPVAHRSGDGIAYSSDRQRTRSRSDDILRVVATASGLGFRSTKSIESDPQAMSPIEAAAHLWVTFTRPLR